MRALVVIALVLCSCTPVIPVTPHAKSTPFTLDQAGVQVSDRLLRIDFGRTDHSTIPAMSKLVGQQPATTRSCEGGGKLVVWPDGTGLIFSAGEFRGWVSAASGKGAGLTCAPTA